MPSPCKISPVIPFCVAMAVMMFSLSIPSRLLAQASAAENADPNSPEAKPKKVWQPGWAGYILYAPGQVPLQIPQNRFQTVEAEWIVPDALATINCDNKQEPTDGSSIWIAMDGWSETFVEPNGSESTDILQAGTETDVPCWNGEASPANAYFWIEWDGTSNIRVTRKHLNLPVNIGDQVHVRIVADTEGPEAWKRATVYFEDETTHRSYTTRFHSGCVICGKHHRETATLFGNTAEWVVETTFYSATNPKLPNTLNNFGTVQVTNLSVTDDKGITYTPANPEAADQEIDWMTWNGDSIKDGDTLLACAAITGPQAITLSRAPYKIVTPGQQGNLEPKPKNCNGTVQPGLY